jgi:hypothetical protein
MSAAWRKIGERLYGQWVEAGHEFDKIFIEAWKARPADPEWDFVRALVSHVRGDTSHLSAYLRSDRELSRLDRELLAQVNEGALGRKAKLGAPVNRRAHDVALCARAFYHAWQGACRDAGVPIRGSTRSMKDVACDYAFQLEATDDPPDYNTVRELIERPANLRE